MLDLHPLVRGSRVAHREDADWQTPTGTVMDIEGNDHYVVCWDSQDTSTGENEAIYRRADLVHINDADAKASGA